MAERQGFEPWVPLTVHTLFKHPPLIFLSGTPTISQRNFSNNTIFLKQEYCK